MRIPTRCTPRVFVLVVAPLVKNVRPTSVARLEAVLSRYTGLWWFKDFIYVAI